MGEADAAVAPGQTVGRQPIQQGRRIGPGHLELGEGAEIGYADPLAHAPHLGTHHVVSVGATERVGLWGAAGREVLGAFPPVDLLPLRSQRVEASP